MYTEAWLPGPRSTQFYTRTYNSTKGDAKAVILFIHGFAEHVGRYTHFHPLLAEHGIAVFAFDQRGFGKTAQDEGHKSKDSAYGKTSWNDQMTDIEWALRHAKEEFPGVPVFLMGHSMVGLEFKYEQVEQMWMFRGEVRYWASRHRVRNLPAMQL